MDKFMGLKLQGRLMDAEEMFSMSPFPFENNAYQGENSSTFVNELRRNCDVYLDYMEDEGCSDSLILVVKANKLHEVFEEVVRSHPDDIIHGDVTPLGTAYYLWWD